MVHKQWDKDVDRQELVLKDVKAQHAAIRAAEEAALEGNPAAKAAYLKKMNRVTGPVPQVRAQIELLEAKRESQKEAVERLEAAESRWHDVVGPRLLQKLVSRRMREGFPLPFRLDFRKGSRYARVNWLLEAASMGLYEEETDAQGNLTPAAQRKSDMMCPGGWQMVLRPGQYVYVNGARFKVVRQDVPDVPDYESSVFTEDEDDATLATLDDDGGAAGVDAEAGAEGTDAVEADRVSELGDGDAKGDNDNDDDDDDDDDDVHSLESESIAGIVLEDFQHEIRHQTPHL
jgi:hypothetical protein